MYNKPKAIFLMGPTASGKSAAALHLVKHLPVEVISVDSALIYRDMNIGTAKPTAEELQQVPHQLIDICSPEERYSVADFREEALREMALITAKGKIPLLVGGTMLYFKALLEGLSPLPKADLATRSQIEQRAEELGWDTLHRELQNIDPKSAQRIHYNDPQRLTRALEVYYLSGKSLSELTEVSGESLPYDVFQFSMIPTTRNLLHQRIERRFRQMIEQGFEQEVRNLMAIYSLNEELPSMRCVGYRQMFAYLSDKISYDDMVYRGICATRQLAKRQITWLRGWASILWLDSDKLDDVIKRVVQVINE